MCVTSLNVWNSCRDQLFHKWNSTEALEFCVEQWNCGTALRHWSSVWNSGTVFYCSYTRSGINYVLPPASSLGITSHIGATGAKLLLLLAQARRSDAPPSALLQPGRLNACVWTRVEEVAQGGEREGHFVRHFFGGLRVVTRSDSFLCVYAVYRRVCYVSRGFVFAPDHFLLILSLVISLCHITITTGKSVMVPW
jgi:hypothetical protein